MRAPSIEDLVEMVLNLQNDLQRVKNARPEDPVYVSVFTNSWVNFGAVQTAYYYRSGGRTYLGGRIKSGSIGSSAFTLLTDYRPHPDDAPVNQPAVSNSLFGMCQVTTAGLVIPVVGSNIWFSLDGINFRHV
jgi:hypothetical protein